MARAEDRSLPLLRRLQALHQCGGLLDRFFQLRMPRLGEEVGVAAASEVRRPVEELYGRQSRLLHRDLMRRLRALGVDIVETGTLSRKEAAYVARIFQKRVFPLLTPLAVDPGHPFLHASQLSLCLAVIVRHPLSRRERLAFLKVPSLLPRFMALPDAGRFLPLEGAVADNLRALFPGMEIARHANFRLTCDGNPEGARDRVGDPFTPRRRRPRAVRLEINPDMPAEVRSLLVRELALAPDDVYVVDGLLDVGWVRYFHPLRTMTGGQVPGQMASTGAATPRSGGPGLENRRPNRRPMEETDGKAVPRGRQGRHQGVDA